MATRDELSIKKHHRTEVKSRLNKNMKVYLAIYANFVSNLLLEMGYFLKLSKLSEYEGLYLYWNAGS